MSDYTAPERIYLQPHMAPEVTWCEDQTDETDVEYVRADVVARLREALENIAQRRCLVGGCADGWARKCPACTAHQALHPNKEETGD